MGDHRWCYYNFWILTARRSIMTLPWSRAKYNEPWPRVQGWVWWAMAHTAVQRRSECKEPWIVTLCISDWQQLRCWKNEIASWRDFTGILWHLSVKPSVTETAGKRCHADVWHARKPSIQVESAQVSATPQNPQLRPARANFPRTPGWALPTQWHRDRDRSRLTLCTGSGSVCARAALPQPTRPLVHVTTWASRCHVVSHSFSHRDNIQLHADFTTLDLISLVQNIIKKAE